MFTADIYTQLDRGMVPIRYNSPTNLFWYQKTRLITLSRGIKILAVSFRHKPRVWLTDRRTDKQTDRETNRQIDRITIPKTALA